MINSEQHLSKFWNVSRCESLFDSQSDVDRYKERTGGGKGHIFTGRLYRLQFKEPDHETDEQGRPVKQTPIGHLWVIPLGNGYAYCPRRPKYPVLCCGESYLITDENDPRLLSNKEGLD